MGGGKNMKPKKRKIRKKNDFRLEGYIFGALRKIWRWHPERKKALTLAKLHDQRADDLYFSCAKCDQFFTRKNIHIDHVDPVVDPAKGFTTWDNYIEGLFVTSDKLQVLCKDCHLIKTQLENKGRRKKNG